MLAIYISIFTLLFGIVLGGILAMHFDLAGIPFIGRLFKTRDWVKTENELYSKEQEVQKLKNEINAYKKEEEKSIEHKKSKDVEMSRKRICYLKKLAFADGKYEPAEKDLIFKYILEETALNCATIVDEMKALCESPYTLWGQVKGKVLSDNPKEMFTKKEEAEIFVDILKDIATVDGEIKEEERLLIEKINNAYSIHWPFCLKYIPIVKYFGMKRG